MQLQDEKIIEFSRAELLQKDTLTALYGIKQTSERERLKAVMSVRAKELDMEKEFVKLLRAYDNAEKAMAAANTKANANKNNNFALKFDSKGDAMATIENFLTIIRGDEFFKGLKFNLLSYSPEQERSGKTVRWEDADDSAARAHIETVYGIHNRDKLDDALRIVFRDNGYHPIRDLIESVTWDGIERIESFLCKWLLCDDNSYSREVSRLIFAGGINRLYHPGCKFDEVPVLIGTKQGEGKSSFVQWLAMRDEYFTEVNTMEGQQGMEAIEGAWICEISELLALTRIKEMESAKSYLSRRVDRYRRPFDRRVTEHPRQCIFIGTTNKAQFLTDKTGNRRFYPIKIKQVGYDLFNQKSEICAEILQCWAEAKYKMDNGNMPAFASRDLIENIRDEQASAVEDDYREGIVIKYLENRNEVCILELWEKAFGNIYAKPGRHDSNDIALIMQSIDKWHRHDKVVRLENYGVQRVWRRDGYNPPEQRKPIQKPVGAIQTDIDDDMPF